MSTFRPPPDADRCRAIVLVGGQRGRCRHERAEGSDLCEGCRFVETREGQVPRVPRAKESQP